MDTTESDYYQFMDFDATNARKVLQYYVQFFAEGPVLELASGPGVFLTLLREAEIAATGVDIDDGMVAESVAAGNDVVLADALEHLAAVASDSQAGVFAAHFLEHLPSEQAQQVYHEAARVLQPGGRFVAVVPNAACLSILGYDFWRDPTHVRFYDPVALQFFAKQAGLGVIATGGNPNNHPGPPPLLHAVGGDPSPGLSDRLVTVVQHANTMLQNRRDATSRRRSANDANGDEEQLWGELGHLLANLDNTVQTLQHELAATRTAYGNLLAQLYPPNEVYVVAEKVAGAEFQGERNGEVRKAEN